MSLLDFILPSVCGACGHVGAAPCADCFARLQPPPPGPLPEYVNSLGCCWKYGGAGRELIKSLKYANNRGALAWYIDVLVSRARHAEVDVVTWVPMAPQHRGSRSVDHNRLLARGVATRIGVCARELLERTDDSPQSMREGSDRRLGPTVHAKSACHRVLLIDDVVTTGASLRNCALALRAGGATEVHAVALARAPVRTQYDRAGNG